MQSSETVSFACHVLVLLLARSVHERSGPLDSFAISRFRRSGGDVRRCIFPSRDGLSPRILVVIFDVSEEDTSEVEYLYRLDLNVYLSRHRFVAKVEFARGATKSLIIQGSRGR